MSGYKRRSLALGSSAVKWPSPVNAASLRYFPQILLFLYIGFSLGFLPLQGCTSQHDELDLSQVHPAEPMRDLAVPHTVQTARRAGRPFFKVTCSISLEPVLARHFKQ